MIVAFVWSEVPWLARIPGFRGGKLQSDCWVEPERELKGGTHWREAVRGETAEPCPPCVALPRCCAPPESNIVKVGKVGVTPASWASARLRFIKEAGPTSLALFLLVATRRGARQGCWDDCRRSPGFTHGCRAAWGRFSRGRTATGSEPKRHERCLRPVWRMPLSLGSDDWAFARWGRGRRGWGRSSKSAPRTWAPSRTAWKHASVRHRIVAPAPCPVVSLCCRPVAAAPPRALVLAWRFFHPLTVI